MEKTLISDGLLSENQSISTSPVDPPPSRLNNGSVSISTSPNEPPPSRLNNGNVSISTSPNEPPPSKSMNSTKDFESLVENYLAESGSSGVPELEIRFGTNPKNGKDLSKNDYDNVIQQFYNAGFTSDNVEGTSILRIQNEELNPNTGQMRMSNIRTEIVGIDMIQEYCRTNNIQKLLDMPSTLSAVAEKIKFTKKAPKFVGATRETSVPLKPVDFPNFNFRVSFQIETDYYSQTNVAKRIISKWLDSKKTFRYINRVRFSHPDYPVFLDVSIIKSSAKKNKYVSIPQYTVQEARLFSGEETYEIELEVDNKRVGMFTQFNTVKPLMASIRKCSRLVMSGLQDTNYPISYTEKDTVLQQYLRLLFGAEYATEYMGRLLDTSKDRRISQGAFRKLNQHFTGPSSHTLQMEHVAPLPEEESKRITTLPNIRENYTVTDKADGERRLLYIAPTGHMYMINTNMSIIFTGIITTDKELYDSLLDGELIKYNKHGKFVNKYAAFDIYYINGKSVREFDFERSTSDDEVAEKFRLPLLNKFVRQLHPKSIMDKDGGNSNPKTAMNKGVQSSCWLTIQCKSFYHSKNGGIFAGCASILSKVNDGSYEYNTDGLIFTPVATGVGGDKSGQAGQIKKYSWGRSFKWKPVEFNTIDFLVSSDKDKSGKEITKHVFQEGIAMDSTQSITQYKQLTLNCGFSRKDHGYINPMLDVINDTVQSESDQGYYEPVPFRPTHPSDPEAFKCNVELKTNGTGGLVLMTAENEYFEDGMIVEFSYDKTREGAWRWIPLRVRYDKTHELRSGGSNFGNPYHVANSNWKTIHNPITNKMITMGLDIPEYFGDEQVYYNRTGKGNVEDNTRTLRNFHNLFVKKKLIVGVSNNGDTLIDYAVGMGGDMSKWITAKLGFVFGIDVSKDNIENKLIGACARYLDIRRKFTKYPRALFVNGNSGRLIRKGDAYADTSVKDRQISDAVFGEGAKDPAELGQGVYKQYGVGKDGFDVSSCQFALHYFFKSEQTLHTFVRNLSECTKLNGHFIGTCYDGQTVFDTLQKKNQGDSLTLYRDETKIYALTKQYSHTGFPEDENSIGYTIDVYQESINKEFPESLVNFKYFQRVMENYGFSVVTKEEAVSLDLPNGTGLFEELYTSMMNDKCKDEYECAMGLSKEEKQISFMNRYFVFRKTHNVNAEKVYKLALRHKQFDDDDEGDKTVIEEAKKTVVIRKLKGKKNKLVIEPVKPTVIIRKKVNKL